MFSAYTHLIGKNMKSSKNPSLVRKNPSHLLLEGGKNRVVLTCFEVEKHPLSVPCGAVEIPVSDFGKRRIHVAVGARATPR